VSASETRSSISGAGDPVSTLGSGPVRSPDIAELETLVACAANGSFAAAAVPLGISRPAVAKRIRNLEALAGRPLVVRGGRGVHLTDAGAALLVGARRMLEERDALVGVLAEIRAGGPSPIAGLRELIGHSPMASRAGQLAETRLAETERVLGFVLRESATGVAISHADTGMIHEVNMAFCRFTGRSRGELVGKTAADTAAWRDVSDRDGLIDALRRTGSVERALIRVRRPDGTMRVGEASAQPVSLAGTRQMLCTVDDVTEQHVQNMEQGGSLTAYRALTRLAGDLFAGRPALESIGRILPDLRLSGGFTTALLWNVDDAAPAVVDGDPPPPGLDGELSRAKELSGGVVMRLDAAHLPSEVAMGWALPLAHAGYTLVLLSAEALPLSRQSLTADSLRDLAILERTAGDAQVRIHDARR
jgi:PAS domain S-box-containing protein